MLVPIAWLKEYVKTKLSPPRIAQIINASTLGVSGLHEVEGEEVLDLEVTSNRGDLLSILGVAAEVAALTGAPFRLPPALQPKNLKPLRVEIDAKNLCPDYVLLRLENIRVGPSPSWLIKRLTQVGLRSVNNVVDVTNYVMFEYGHPLHAFDAESVRNGRIVVRLAREGETITTLDGKIRALSGSILLIADHEKALGIAGIMGGQKSEVSSQTRAILLEAAIFDPTQIRRSARSLGLRSEASLRFEHGLSSERLAPAAHRAAQLIRELTGARLTGFARSGEGTHPNSKVRLPKEQIEKLLGIKISLPTTKRILRRLGCSIEEYADRLVVLPPAHRLDLKIPEDLIEEIARVKGYETIPNRINPPPEKPQSLAPPEAVRERLSQTGLALGLNEIISEAFLSVETALLLGFREDTLVRLKTPPSTEMAFLRPSLLPGLLLAISHNCQSFEKGAFFELGKVYAKEGPIFTEKSRLGAVIWAKEENEEALFRQAKGYLYRLLDRCGLKNESLTEKSEKPKEIVLCLKNGPLGKVALLSPQIGLSVGISFPVAYLLLDVEKLIGLSELIPIYRPIHKTSAVKLDLSFRLPAKTGIGEAMQSIRKAGAPLLSDLELFDRYGDGVAFHLIFQAPDRSLTEEEAKEVLARIETELTSQIGAQLRGEVRGEKPSGSPPPSPQADSRS